MLVLQSELPDANDEFKPQAPNVLSNTERIHWGFL